MRHQYFVLPLLVFAVISCQSPVKPTLSFARQIPIDSTIAQAPSISAAIAPLRDSVGAIMNEAIGSSPKELFSNKPESPLSSFVADLLKESAIKELNKTGRKPLPVISVINIRGLRAPLPKGIIRVKDIYALMPFENKMVILKMAGKDVKRLYQHMGESRGDGLSGGSFTFSNQSVQNPKINNKPIDDDTFYYVATSDYLATGGDHYTIFANTVEKYESPNKIRDLIIQHIRELNEQGKQIPAPTNQRIQIQ